MNSESIKGDFAANDSEVASRASEVKTVSGNDAVSTQQEAPHTPGPWVLWGRAEPSQVITAVDRFVAQTLGGNDAANARLIAAAPDLLEALRPFANYACDVPCECHNCRARAAIAKATGGAA